MLKEQFQLRFWDIRLALDVYKYRMIISSLRVVVMIRLSEFGIIKPNRCVMF
jgi:hypothetical protein